MPTLFDPLEIRSLKLRNRLVVSPMCQYLARPDGIPTEWHQVHLGARAVGGFGLILVEASAVEPRGRLSIGDVGLWSARHVEPLRRIVRFVKEQGAAIGIQIAHGGRKAWSSDKANPPASDPNGAPLGAVAPSAIPFDRDWAVPEALDAAGIDRIVAAFTRSAELARDAGFDVVEIHAAHGYLLHEFLSPLSNHRSDEYGGTPDKRARLLDRVIAGVRSVWPATHPLWLRLSCSDYVEGGLDVAACAAIARRNEKEIDVVDCSSGGNVPDAKIPFAPGYQVPFAQEIRKHGVATCAVGLLTEPKQCDDIVREGRADLVALARQALRDPYFPLHAAQALGVDLPYFPRAYVRAK